MKNNEKESFPQTSAAGSKPQNTTRKFYNSDNRVLLEEWLVPVVVAVIVVLGIIFLG